MIRANIPTMKVKRIDQVDSKTQYSIHMLPTQQILIKVILVSIMDTSQVIGVLPSLVNFFLVVILLLKPCHVMNWTMKILKKKNIS